MTDCCLRVLSKNDLKVQVAETINVTQMLMYTQLPIAETRIYQGPFHTIPKIISKIILASKFRGCNDSFRGCNDSFIHKSRCGPWCLQDSLMVVDGAGGSFPCCRDFPEMAQGLGEFDQTLRLKTTTSIRDTTLHTLPLIYYYQLCWCKKLQ